MEQVLQAKIKGSDFNKSASEDKRQTVRSLRSFLRIRWISEKTWESPGAISLGLRRIWPGKFCLPFTSYALLLCKVIIILMQFVQKVVVIGFKLYTPIAVAEYAHRSLKSKAVGFFLTFVGVLSWPVGWSLVNTVTLGIFKSLPAPQNQNFATLMIAIVLAIPVLLWVLIGHVVAPIFVQKVVIRGGAVIQGFAGTIFSAVGASSMAIYGGGLAGSASLLGNTKQNTGRDEQEARPVEYAPNQGTGEFFR